MRFLSTVLASALGCLVALGIFMVFFLMIFAGIAAIESGGPVVREGSVLTVRIAGDLPETSETDPIQVILSGRSAVSLRQATRAIRHAATDDRIAGLWLMTQRTSSSWAVLEEIRGAVTAFRQSGKPTIATSSAEGYSERDYFVASAAQGVYSPPQALFEFNGFVLVAQFLKGLLEKLDIEVEAVRAGRFKSAVEPFTRTHASDENREQLEGLVASQAEVFLTTIAASRGLAVDELDRLTQSAAVVSAEDAHAAGLLDGLQSASEVRRFLADSLLHIDGDPEFIGLGDYVRVVPSTVAGTSPDDVVAVVYAVGTIVDGSSGFDSDPLFGGRRAGSSDLVKALREVREDERIKAVVLRIDSPGGSGRASDVIWHAVHQTAAAKPLVASMGSVAASGGYYIAAPADSIVADASTVTGSIGVFSLLINTSGLLEEKLGITFDAVKTAPTADMFTGLRRLTDFERSILEKGVDDMYDRFTAIVAEGRGMDIDSVLSVAAGRTWTGSQAVKNGLVDRLGSLDDAIAMAARDAGLDSTGYRVSVFPKEKTLVERLWRMASVAESRAAANLFAGYSDAAMVRQLRLLREAERLHGSVQARLPVSFAIE